MTSPIKEMLDAYRCKTTEDYRNALKEIVQEIALLGLYRSGFFNMAAFYGGTCLRIFHGMQRFSEDLDFSLLNSNTSFSPDIYLEGIREELGAFGFTMTVENRKKPIDSHIQSAFIKGNTLIHLINIASINPPVEGVSADERLKIKVEIDTNPPAGAGCEYRYQLIPVTYLVKLYDPPSLFAGKIHALLCRSWKNRVKGRDFYDYLWYLSRSIPINLPHLQARMIQSGHWDEGETLNDARLKELLLQRFSSVDYKQVKADVSPFIKNPDELEMWNTELFTTITRNKLKSRGLL